MRKILLFVSLIFFIKSILSLQVSITKILPQVVNSNNYIDLNVCLTNNDNQGDNLINLNIYYPYCVFSNITSLSLNYLSPGNTYCFPLEIYENCPQGFYNIIINGTYENNNGLNYFSQFYSLIVQNIPYITIPEYFYLNNYYGAIANLSINLTDNGEEIYNLLIYSNYSTCLLQPSSIYFSNFSGSKIISFNLIIPTNYANNYCTIPLNIQFQDSLGNNYNYLQTINVPIIPQNNKIEILYNVSYLNIGENRINITLYNPTNSIIKDISLQFLQSNLSIINSFIFIPYLNPGQSMNVPINVIVPNNVFGIQYIPFIITYYSNSIQYNLQGNIVENINSYPELTLSGYYSSGAITFNIFNYGNSPAYNLYVNAYCSNCILTPNQGYIGELDPGNSNSVIFTINNENRNSTVYLTLYYTDVYGNKYVDQYNFTLEELGYMGIEIKNNQSNIFGIFIFILIIGGLTYYLIKRRKK
ncbi:MAG: hypothetical protein ACP5GJ_03315 [Nanopusillaceae archaeon]|jgi:hypothetical protein